MDEPIRCPVCNLSLGDRNNRRIPYPSEHASDRAPDPPDSIVFCHECGVGVAVPVLSREAQEELYSQGGYWKYRRERNFLPRAFPGHYALASSRVDFVEPFLRKRFGEKPISVLDIGAGYGFFAAALSEKSGIPIEKYCAIEKDAVLSGSLKKTLHKFLARTRITVGNTLDKITGEFDLVVLSNVIEHLSEPKRMLASLKKLLAAGAYIFIDTPNKDYSFKRSVFPHILFFDTHSLKRFLHECHFEIAEISCFGRTAQDSPLHRKNEGKLLARSGRVFQALRHAIPMPMAALYFKWYFGASMKNPDGTWIRTLAYIRKETQ